MGHAKGRKGARSQASLGKDRQCPPPRTDSSWQVNALASITLATGLDILGQLTS